MKKAYDRIKKRYGEKFARLCRTNFPELMEDDNFLPDLIEKHFAPSRFLYDDIIKADKETDFKNFIYRQVEKEDAEVVDIQETPEELMDKAGYTLHKCETNDDIQSFRHYWRPDEALCTFRDSSRINSHTIFFAVKKNVDEIRREYFTKPRWDDKYGISVISIQFTKGSSSTVSIKNSYNHTVSDPDATFSNDLENIYPGLKDSFSKYYGINFLNNGQKFEIPGYVLASDGKYYKYNYEIDNVYYCPNNVIIKNSNPIHYDKSRYEIIDYFVLDKVDKTIKLNIDFQTDVIDYELTEDAFTNDFYEKNSFGLGESNIKNIEILNKDNDERIIKITNNNGEECEIIIDKYNRIVEYSNENIKNIGNNFLCNNTALRKLDLPNVKAVGDNFLFDNECLKEMNIPKLTNVGPCFLYSNNSLEELTLPELRYASSRFLYYSQLKKLNLPNLIQLGACSLYHNNSLTHLSLPNLEILYHDVMCSNNSLIDLDIPKVKSIPINFLPNNHNLQRINIPSAIHIGDRFLKVNKTALKEIIMTNVTTIGNGFLCTNESLEEIDAPNLREVGYDFLRYNVVLRKANLPKLTDVGVGLLYDNDGMEELNMPEDSIPEYLRYVLERNKGHNNETLT